MDVMESTSGKDEGHSSGFTTVAQLRPDTMDHNLHVKVVEVRPVHRGGAGGGRSSGTARLSECIVGDETGVVVFTASGADQVALAQVGQYLTLRNAKVDMFKGSMRISCGKWGSAVVADDLSFQPNEDYNVSLVEYELVPLSLASSSAPTSAPAEQTPAPIAAT